MRQRYQLASPSPNQVLALQGKVGPESSDRIYWAACAAIRMLYINTKVLVPDSVVEVALRIQQALEPGL